MEKPDLFKRSDGKTGFSSLDFDKVLRFLGSSPCDPPKNCDIDDMYLRILSEELIITYKSIGPPTVGNESTKCEFVSPFMKVAVASMGNINISLRKEYSIKGEIVAGPVEYVVVDGEKILLVVEAKKDDWTQGRTQLLMEMYEAYQMNMKNNIALESYKLYGSVCNGDTWEFISYSNNGGWKYYGRFQPFPRDLDSDVLQYQKECKEVLCIIRGMIKESIDELCSDPE